MESTFRQELFLVLQVF